MGYLSTLPAFLTWFPLAVALLVAFVALYSRVTPWRELALIKEGNLAAACSFVGAVLGYSVVLASILAHAHSRSDFLVWSLVGLGIQLAVLPVAKLMLGGDLRKGIEEGKTSLGVVLGGMALGAGIINAAAMTP